MTKKKSEVEIDTINLVSINDVVEDKSILKIQERLPLEAKMQMVDDIVSMVTDINENGMLEVVYKIKQFMFDVVVMRYFTNLNLPSDNSLEIYNLACKNDIVQYIYTYILSTEIEYIKDCVDNTIEQNKSLTNGLENVIDRGIKQFISTVEQISDKLTNVIPTEKGMKSIIKQIKSFDPEKATMVQDMVDTISGKNQTKSSNAGVPKMTKSDKEKLTVVE